MSTIFAGFYLLGVIISILGIIVTVYLLYLIIKALRIYIRKNS
ncbi:MAG: hypothetical protein K0S47_2132 [Herbinix sp.]|jgi:hypothetical protein|nr:hypothetical protein [Herbinix sp.]